MNDEYARRTALGSEALRRGDFSTALVHYRMARTAAAECDDPDAVDRADLNIAMARLQMGDARGADDGLRELLLRTRDPKVAFTAAYNVACGLRKQGHFERALRYATRALEKAEEVGAADMLSPAHNLLGNIHLGRSHLDQALQAYRRALEIRDAQTGDTRYSRAILEENVGYCLLLKKDMRGGLARIAHALALATDVGDRRCRAECLQDLCYGSLIAGDLDEALRHGEAALDEANSADYADIVENCHYLLGEIGVRLGDSLRRDLHFNALQALHPEIPFLSEFLCAVDVTTLITLKR